MSAVEPLLATSAPFTGAQANSCGWTRWKLERLLREGLVRRVMRDVYVGADVPDSMELRAAAAALVLAPHAVMVDRTAAWLWGVDTFEWHELAALPPLETFVLRGRKRVRRQQARGGARDLRPEEIVRINGVSVTTPLRTALDLACRLPRYEALAALDAFARHHGVTSRNMCTELARRYRRRRGVVQARELAQLADPRSESTGEGWTRLAIHDEGLPPPQLQVWVYDGSVPIFRLDLAYERLKICVEYDGAEFHTTEEQKEHDRRRRTWLRDHGWWVLVVDKHSFKGAAREKWLGELRRAIEERS